ncbi:hypothetical protein CTEN210_01763 [Chaetoceros tenuissimus]|uniref:Uncharacterized protein n=1 Tax=Chaetoceros tenuissimus TaxID=426638 RepID=A0AAD3H0E4_9STRA|nr:hypothetical protein CTEN210_01763 [Chaetoceros tenuissimus]
MSLFESSSVLALSSLLRQEPLPKELEVTILPFPDDDEETSFMKDGIHLGIHAPHVPKLAREFRKLYYSLRHIAIGLPSGGSDHKDESYLLDCISCLLLLCPDHATAWADRKRLLQSCWRRQNEVGSNVDSQINFWKDELRYMNMLFTQHSKAPNAWNHRRWICRQILYVYKNKVHKVGDEDPIYDILVQWATVEIAICTVIAEKYPKNYYAWTHRNFVIKTMLSLSRDDKALSEIVEDLISSEVDMIGPWLKKHVSDHSAVHYGGEVLRCYLDIQLDDMMKLKQLEAKLEESLELIEKHTSHEVIWIWRRILSRLLITLLVMTDQDLKLKIFMTKEIEFVRTLLSKHTKTSDLQEMDFTYRYSSTYILWVINYIRKAAPTCLDSIKVDFSEIRKDIIAKGILGEDTSVKTKVWEITIE